MANNISVCRLACGHVTSLVFLWPKEMEYSYSLSSPSLCNLLNIQIQAWQLGEQSLIQMQKVSSVVKCAQVCDVVHEGN